MDASTVKHVQKYGEVRKPSSFIVYDESLTERDYQKISETYSLVMAVNKDKSNSEKEMIKEHFYRPIRKMLDNPDINPKSHAIHKGCNKIIKPIKENPEHYRYVTC